MYDEWCTQRNLLQELQGSEHLQNERNGVRMYSEMEHAVPACEQKTERTSPMRRQCCVRSWRACYTDMGTQGWTSCFEDHDQEEETNLSVTEEVNSEQEIEEDENHGVIVGRN